MRDVDGFLPQEALDELLKFLLYKNYAETADAEQWSERSLCDDPKLIRQTFSDALSSRSSWVRQLWQSGRFHLSDRTLLDLQHLFGHVRLSDISLDVRSAALRTFLSSDATKRARDFSDSGERSESYGSGGISEVNGCRARSRVRVGDVLDGGGAVL